MMRHGLPWVGTDTTGLAEMLDATPELRVHIAETGWDGEDFTSRLAACMDLLLSDGAAHARAAEAVGRLYASRYKAAAMVEGMRAVVEHAFARPGYTLPDGYLPYMDARMMGLVNDCPDIDLDFYGMGGIGVYLWTRALELWDKEEEAYRLAEILEYLIYYMDWLEEACTGGTLPAEVVAMLQSMARKGFYKTCVEALLEGQPASGVPHGMPSGRTLMQNTLKICNCKI